MLIRQLVLALGLLPTSLAGGQIGRKGLLRHAEVKQRRAEVALASREAGFEQARNNNGNYRFRNAKTEQFLVTSMPDVNWDFGEMYAGTIPLNDSPPSKRNNTGDTTDTGHENPTGNATAEDALFFIFKPKDGEPVDELTIWLNGGPGCSSLEGYLQETGPISWQPGTFLPTPNPYAWSNLTNMIWIDQPVGTGFSSGTPKATSQEDIAADMLRFLKKFEDTFGISNFKIYITGESYAGRYVPYIANAMLDSHDTEHFNISGILVYDPCIGNFDYVQQEAVAYPHIEANWNLWGFNDTQMAQFKQLHEQCGYDAFIKQYMSFPPSGQQPALFWNSSDPANRTCDIFNIALEEVLNINPCFNPYEIPLPCPVLWDVLGFPGILTYTPAGANVYFDRPEVKAALHAPSDVKWEMCSADDVFVAGGGKAGPHIEGDLSADPIQSVLPRVIEATQRVLVSNGDMDYIIITNGTLLAIQNMTWGGQLGFQAEPAAPFVVDMPDVQWSDAFKASGLEGLNGPQCQMGIQHFERGLMWVQVWGAGHMLPQYQPRAGYMHLEWVLGRTDTLG